jgi:hypothetical protein
MYLRKKKFLKIKNIYNFFEQNNKKLILIVHVNNFNNIESNFIHYYCLQNNIISLYLNINLTKKISLNYNFVNLLSGPTKIYVFDSLNCFFNFLNNKYIVKNFIPLTIF